MTSLPRNEVDDDREGRELLRRLGSAELLQLRALLAGEPIPADPPRSGARDDGDGSLTRDQRRALLGWLMALFIHGGRPGGRLP